jgi:hypothetical protein
MHITMQKAEFSKAFVHAVATVAGYKVQSCDVDDDSIDIELVGTRQQGTVSRAPHLGVQLKTTETDDGLGATLAFQLPIKNYNDLRATDVHVPRILVVLTVPPDLTEWLHHTPEETAIRRVAYWLSLRGLPEVDNDTARTVQVQRDRRFTVNALTEMMGRIGDGGLP